MVGSGGVDLRDEAKLSHEHLRVYPPRPEEIEGAGEQGEEPSIWWTPGHGLVRTPPGWTFVPRGDAFVTRKVKAAGLYWEVVRARPKKGYTERLGLLAPAAHVAEALQYRPSVLL